MNNRANLRNWISLSGTVLSCGALFAFFLLFLLDVITDTPNPYMGILAYIVAPGFFLLGLAFILFGWFWQKRRAAAGKAISLSIDLSKSTDRHRLAYFGLAAFGFMLLTSVGSYQTYHYTESVAFCGQVCHTPMEPQFATYQVSPHARIACVECHIGSNPAFFVESKISGVRKVRLALTDGFDRPIHMHESSGRIIETTCKECHSPRHYQKELVRNYDHYLSDDDNTYFGLTMMVNAKGGAYDDPHKGSHWHTDKGNRVEFVTEPDEDYGERIPWVRVTTPSGDSHVYRVPDYEEKPDDAQLKTMSCIACHNRPSHQFTAPNNAIEEGLKAGKLDRSLPGIKFAIGKALTAEYETRSDADKGIALLLKEKYGSSPGVEKQIEAVRAIYHANFFPEMKTNWQSHPDHNGHKDTLGCFRCHDDEHVNEATGRVISAKNCNSCHTVLAQGTTEELNQVSWSGVDFKHPDGGYFGLTCADCHTGGVQEE